MNQLQNALSPYLLQHQNNPVHWQEWTAAALAEAKNRNVPIFLSIGYAACHWCHVMAEESFEDAEIANYLNQHFVPIKVDREERPDLDNTYMQALMQFTGQGGWPLNLFLFPDGKPFWGGTYFPKQPRYNLPSFMEVLKHVVGLWNNQRATLEAVADGVLPALTTKLSSDNNPKLPDWNTFAEKHLPILAHVDTQFGGLNGAPKFPQISLWQWLFSLGIYGQQPQLINACFITAENLCQGGIYDHLGGGWMRYSTDSYWKVPHFEKMLYDNAQIIDWLATLYSYQPKPLFAERISETITWLNQEILLPCGAYAASLNADSEHEEGKYYVWSWDEIKKILGEQADVFLETYGCLPEGNWEGKNILYRNHPNKVLLDHSQLASLREKLYQIRTRRIKPSQDDKVLLDWNSMLIKALLKASWVFDQKVWREQAEELYQALKKLLYHDHQWYRCFRNQRYQHLALLEDMAHLIEATIELYAITGHSFYLTEAKQWLQQTNEHFFDSNNGLYFQVSSQAPSLIANPQTVLDGATPAGNGIMATNLAKLFILTGNSEYVEHLETMHKTILPLLNSAQGYQLSHFALSITWLQKGIIIKGNLAALELNLDFINDLPSLIILQNIANQSYFECCNARECLAKFDDVILLKEWLNSFMQK